MKGILQKLLPFVALLLVWAPQVPQAHAARLWDIGWELQSNLDGVDEGALSWNGQGTIDTSVKRSGSAAMRINSVGASSKNFDQTLAFSNITTNAYADFGFLVHANPTGTVEIAEIGAAAGVPRAQLKLTSGGQLQLFDGQAGTQIGSNSTTLSLDTWYYVEFEWSSGTYAARLTPDSTGVTTTFASGAPTTSGTGVNVTRFGVSTTDATLNVVYDDIKVNDSSGSNQTSWPGNGKLIRLIPASGDSQMW
jgi:hypothetical protein